MHRDLNPRNVLVTDKGVPKITDYGISKILDDRDAWLPRVGRTLFDARTPGFSPKEPDDRNHSRARDCYSLACIAAFCLVGRKIEDDADLAVAVQEATFPDVVRPLIDDAPSDEPRRRPIDARMMLERIQRIEAAQMKVSLTLARRPLEANEVYFLVKDDDLAIVSHRPFLASDVPSKCFVPGAAFATRLSDQVRLIATIANARQADGREQ